MSKLYKTVLDDIEQKTPTIVISNNLKKETDKNNQ